MRIAVLVKQIPKFEEMELGPDGRLRRDGIEPEMNPYCRRAVSKAVELAAERAGSHVTVFTLGPPRRRRHAARGDRVGPRARRRHRRRARHRRRVRRLRHARDREGARRRARRARARSTSCSPAATRSTPTPARSAPSSPSCSTCRSSPACATSRSTATRVDARCEHDDGWMQAEVELPAVLSCAERLCDPTKVDPPGPGRGARRPHPPR